MDDSPYDDYYSYYFVDADKLSTDGETPEKPAADKQAEQKPAAPAKEEQKPEAKPEEQKPAADKKEESFDDLRPLEELPLGGHASSFDKNGFPINWSEAKKQAYIEKFGLPKGAKKVLLAKLKLTNMTASGELLEQKKMRHGMLWENSTVTDLKN